MFRKFRPKLLVLILSLLVVFVGCGKKNETGDTGAMETDKLVIQNAGSDTMVNLAQAWAEQYAKIAPNVSVEVSGGGSGTGIAALINGTVDLANSSRKIEPEEAQKALQHNGEEPQEFVVGYDALAVYVHKDNPLNEITIEQLADIYGEGGSITKWSQLGIQHSGCSSDEIIRVSRQSNSGTYHYFREALLGTADFRLGSRDLHGSKDVVELIAKTPCAIGYSGMGYAIPEVKMLKVARTQADPYFAPSIETTLNSTYPIARPLYMYSLGTPNEVTKEYLVWIFSDVGQRIVQESGYVPLPEDQRMMPLASPGE
ncbi:MAG TPA: phosphate ABC transporter substrate-binding protein [bacterium]